jgi:asparagine synthase (glutamine-hydrolysing)
VKVGTSGVGSAALDRDITFWMSVYRDGRLACRTLEDLRRHFPMARVIVRSDGDDDPMHHRLVDRHRLEYRLEDRLFPIENGGRLVHRMLQMFLERPTRYLFKIDPDTAVHRRFTSLPARSGHFGTVQGRDGHRSIQGGCMGFTQDAAESLLESGLLLTPGLASPQRTDTMSHWTILEFRARTFGLASFDWSLGWAAQCLGIPLFDYPEVFCVSYRNRARLPMRIDGRFAMTHPASYSVARYAIGFDADAEDAMQESRTSTAMSQTRRTTGEIGNTDAARRETEFMNEQRPLHQVFDLTDPGRNIIFNMTVEDARGVVAGGDPTQVHGIDGHFALVGRRGHIVRLARSLSLPMRYFIAKQADGPVLVVADRIDVIRDFLTERGMSDQFHPSYTRMVPAHYVTEVALVGCPDPNPTYTRFLAPPREALPADVASIGKAYIGALDEGIIKHLARIPADEPIGVCFSGGIDSGAVFVVTHHAMLRLGMNPSRLKAFTLSVDGGGDDLDQAQRFLEQTGLAMFHEPIDVDLGDIDAEETVRVVEDYKPLDVQAAAMTLALHRGIRFRYPQWKYLLDGDGGDENLKDYPIEENPELTIRSVLNNLMLYQEGWGVDSIKHSLTFTGGLSRGCTRTYAPATTLGFSPFSPFTLPSVVEVAEGIPFIALTDWRHEALYRLKGEVVSRGVESVTGVTMPVFEKRRFQHGAVEKSALKRRLPDTPDTYRRMFHAVFDH